MISVSLKKDTLSEDIQQKLKNIPKIGFVIVQKASEKFKEEARNNVLSSSSTATLGQVSGKTRKDSFYFRIVKTNVFIKSILSSPMANLFEAFKERKKVRFLSKHGRWFKSSGILEKIAKEVVEDFTKNELTIN